MSVSILRLLCACGTAGLLALTATACAEDGKAVGTVVHSLSTAEAKPGDHGGQKQSGHEAEAGAEHGAEAEGGHGAEAASEGVGGHEAEAGSGKGGEHAAEAGGGEHAAEAGGHGASAAEEHTVSNPYLKGCHKIKGGADKLVNRTNADLLVFVGEDCTGEKTHIGRKLGNTRASGAEVWHSFQFVN